MESSLLNEGRREGDGGGETGGVVIGGGGGGGETRDNQTYNLMTFVNNKMHVVSDYYRALRDKQVPKTH